MWPDFFRLLLRQPKHHKSFTMLRIPKRTQVLNQFTDVFISSPVSGQMLGNVAGYFAGAGSSRNRYFSFNPNGGTLGTYVQILFADAATTEMIPGQAYVLQTGGDLATIGAISQAPVVQDYSSGSGANGGTIVAGIVNGRMNLIGNPYLDFLDADAFLLDSDNAGKVTGPLLLWAHNTLVSAFNPNPDDPSTYRFTANDFALYNVLGGVAAGRWINASDENTTYTGIDTPNGKLGLVRVSLSGAPQMAMPNLRPV